ncbi:MAG: amidase family protein, partial [Pseudomonadales bacterium]
MSIRRPGVKEVQNLASSLYMNFSDQEAQSYMSLLKSSLDIYDVIDKLPDNLPRPKYPRIGGAEPDPEDNPLNAWYQKTSILGESGGLLSGKRVVLKDNISLAGVGMMNGSSTLEGYVSDIDATVVTRILEAGGEIAGKAHCEHFCLSGGSHTTSKGPIRNPHDPERSSGGSSGGCGALVGSGEIDMAIGGDQGGSIRIPSSWCGCVGMKATWGLVPYTGAMAIEATVDHLGPITNNVANNALLLEAIAGSDGLDPRQYSVQVNRYSDALNQS